MPSKVVGHVFVNLGFVWFLFFYLLKSMTILQAKHLYLDDKACYAWSP